MLPRANTVTCDVVPDLTKVAAVANDSERRSAMKMIGIALHRNPVTDMLRDDVRIGLYGPTWIPCSVYGSYSGSPTVLAGGLRGLWSCWW